MPSISERAAQCWFQLTNLLPLDGMPAEEFADLTEQCTALIATAIAPPVDKSEAWEAVMAALTHGTLETQVEALYVYREAVLKWQREVVDTQAREAELAIARLRSYTRKDG